MTEMPKFTHQAAGLYQAQGTERGCNWYAAIEHTTLETREVYGYHGWYWTVDWFGTREQSELAYYTKRDAEASLRRNWAQLFA